MIKPPRPLPLCNSLAVWKDLSFKQGNAGLYGLADTRTGAIANAKKRIVHERIAAKRHPNRD